MSTLTHEQKYEILKAIQDARWAGDRELADKLFRQIPLSPMSAVSFVETFGPDYVKENFDLSRADAELGEGWIDKVEPLFAFANE